MTVLLWLFKKVSEIYPKKKKVSEKSIFTRGIYHIHTLLQGLGTKLLDVRPEHFLPSFSKRNESLRRLSQQKSYFFCLSSKKVFRNTNNIFFNTLFPKDFLLFGCNTCRSRHFWNKSYKSANEKHDLVELINFTQ